MISSVIIITLFYLYQLVLRKEWEEKCKSIWRWSLYIVIVLTLSGMYIGYGYFEWYIFLQCLGFSVMAIFVSLALAIVVVIPMDYTRIQRKEIKNIIQLIFSSGTQLHLFTLNKNDPTIELIDSEKIKIRYWVGECEVSNLQQQMEYTKTLLDRFQECDYGLECDCVFENIECKRRTILYAVKEYKLPNHVLIAPFFHLRIIIQNHRYLRKNAKSGK